MRQLISTLILITGLFIVSHANLFSQENLKIKQLTQDSLVARVQDSSIGERSQRRAVSALRMIGSETIIDFFIKSLENDSLNVYVRSDMVDALGDWKLQRTIIPLIEVFKNRSNHKRIRRRLTNTFGKIKSPLAVDPLIKALSERDQNVREGAVYALGKIGTQKSIDTIIELIDDGNKNVSRAANTVLRTLRPDLKVELLLASIEDEWLYQSENAIKELSSMGEIIVEKLHREIKGKNDHFRWQVLRVLSRIKSEMSVNLFLELINDKNHKISNECAVGLAGIKSEESIEPLILMLNSESMEIMETVIWILGEIRSDKAVKPLKKLAGSENNKIRKAAKVAINKIIKKELFIIALEYFPDYYKNKITYPIYPDLIEKKPEIPSPVFTPDNSEYIIGLSKNNKYSLIPVTLVENMERNKEWREKGRQLYVDFSDFPALAETGLHSDAELDHTKSITGRSISEINYLARPDRSSGAGFIAADEDIISVIKGDNRLIRKIGLIQDDIIRPLFHFWNMVVEGMKNDYWNNESLMMKGLFYNNYFINTTADGKGYQESIFDDEVLGNLHLEMWRDPTENEICYLNDHYSHLTEKKMANLKKKLFHIHTGEMAIYYARWYGFYEGHTDYRADPIAIACIFGIKSIEEIDKAFDGQLYEVLTEHHTSKK